MPGDDGIGEWLDELGGDGSAAAIRLAMRHAPALLGTPGIARTLLLDPQRDAARRLRLFEALVGQGGLDRENGGRLGAGFLAEAQETIEGLAASGGLDAGTALSLGRAYARAEIDAPGTLTSFLLCAIEAHAASDGYSGDFVAELDCLRREAGGDTHRLHATLQDMLGLIPAPQRPGFVHGVAVRDQAMCGRLALYWLLDPAEELRHAAAGGMLERARRGALDPGTAGTLPSPELRWRHRPPCRPQSGPP